MASLLKISVVVLVSYWGFLAHAEMSAEAKSADKIYKCNNAIIYKTGDRVKMKTKTVTEEFSGNTILELHGKSYTSMTSKGGSGLYFDESTGNFAFASAKKLDDEKDLNCLVLGDKSNEEIYVNRLTSGWPDRYSEYINDSDKAAKMNRDGSESAVKKPRRHRKAKVAVKKDDTDAPAKQTMEKVEITGHKNQPSTDSSDKSLWGGTGSQPAAGSPPAK